jgi:catechol 2,3-dioxygenase-like lactoylglutathione lyase family enzyme
MRIEHAGMQVSEPGKMGDWYVKHLGFTIKRAADAPVPVRFIADASGKVMLEIYNNPKIPAPDYFKADPLFLHIAFTCDDVPGTMKRLIEAGATQHADIEHTPAGDELVFLRDPWGFPIQLAHRAKAMV